MALPNGLLFAEPQNKPLDTSGRFQAGATRLFTLTDGVTLAPVYRDAFLQYPFTQSPTRIGADGKGRFPPIYMDPTITYRVRLFSVTGALLEDATYVNNPYSTVTVVKPTNTTVPATTIVDDPDMRFNVVTNATYLVDMILSFQGLSTSSAVQLRLRASSLDATTAAPVTLGGVFFNSPALNRALLVNDVLGSGQVTLNTSPIQNVVNLRAALTTGNAAGICNLRWTAANDVVTLLKGSTLTAQRIN